jgi:hypothetical protein
MAWSLVNMVAPVIGLDIKPLMITPLTRVMIRVYSLKPSARSVASSVGEAMHTDIICFDK